MIFSEAGNKQDLMLHSHILIDRYVVGCPGLRMAPTPSSGHDSTTPPIRHTEFWLHDGSIVLQVQGTLFKIHQTILANHSEVFSDLFSIPQPDGDEGERMDGCHVVHLHDAAEDFTDLLKAIYHPSYDSLFDISAKLTYSHCRHFDTLPSNADLDTLITFVGGILRLSTKYIIRELRKRCIKLLKGRFPATYEDYMTRATHQRTSTTPTPSLSQSTATVADLTALANLITFSLMPALSNANNHSSPPSLQTSPSFAPPTFQASNPPVSATTSSSRSNSNSHSHSPPQPHGTVSASTSPPSSSHHHSHPHSRPHSHRTKLKAPKPKPEPSPPKPKSSSIMRAISLAYQTNTHLILPYAYYLLARTSSPRRFLSHSSSSPISWHQKTICLVGRSLLHSAEISMSHSFLIAPQVAPRCRSPTQCADSKGSLTEWALLEASGKGPEPLKPYDRWDKLGVCSECVEEAKRKHENGREEVWARLPSFFDLDSWDKLKEMQER